MSPSALAPAAIVATLLFVAWVLARIAQSTGFPPAAALVVLGIVAGSLAPRAFAIVLTPATLGAFLPALIFEGAWDVDFAALRRVAGTIALLAIVGVLATAFVVAAAAATLGGLAWPAALALGAIVSATDPVAVLALFRRIDVPIDLFTIVAGESIANDGVAAVFLAALVPLASGAPFTLAQTVVATVVVALGGVAIGTVVAFAVTPILRRERRDWERIATTLVVAYGAYLAASLAGVSGIFASAAAGIALPAFSLGKRDAEVVERFWDRVAELANAIVFLLVGLNLRVDRIAHEPGLVAATLGATIVARLLLAYGLVRVPRGVVRPRAWRDAIALSGIRGGLSLALALGLPANVPGRPAVIDAIFAVVFVTLVVQGAASAPVLRRLQFA